MSETMTFDTDKNVKSSVTGEKDRKETYSKTTT